MPHKANIIVVSPEPTVLTSLRFMLEAEGYFVRVCDRLSEAVALGGGYDCAVVDHRVIGKSLLRLGEIAMLSRPVVLLVDQKKEFSIPDVIRFVEMPLLGSTVTDAVGSALSSR